MIILCNECGLIYETYATKTNIVVVCPKCGKLQFIKELYKIGAMKTSENRGVK